MTPSHPRAGTLALFLVESALVLALCLGTRVVFRTQAPTPLAPAWQALPSPVPPHR
jgi:hypothetical protein